MPDGRTGAPAEPSTARRRQIAEVARVLLDAEGPEALTMRRIADALGIRAPSLYKHVPDKAALEALVVARGFEEMGADMAAAVADVSADGPTGRLAALGEAYRLYALAHPDLYRLMYYHPLQSELLPDGVEDTVNLPILDAVGHDAHRARAVRAFAHGMASLEIDGRFPDGADLDGAWAVGLGSLMITAHEHTVQQ